MFKQSLIFLVIISCLQLSTSLGLCQNLQASQDNRVNTDTPCIKKRLLVTGCARSGTGYISAVLKLCGLDIGHEYVGEDGCSSWPMAVDALACPWGPTTQGLEFEHTFHQVRHPLLVISSVNTTEPQVTWDYVCHEMPQIKQEDPRIVKCAKYWYYWNLAAEKKAEWTYKLEEIDLVFEEMGCRLGVPLNKLVLKLVSRSTNHRWNHIHDYTWDDLRKELPKDLFDNIQKMAVRYGYSIDDTSLNDG